MKLVRKFIISLLLVIGLFGTIISGAMALGLDEVRIKTVGEGQTLRTTEVKVQVAARQAVECEYEVGVYENIGDEDPALTDFDDRSFDAPARARVQNNKFTIDYSDFFDETSDVDRTIRKGNRIIRIFEIHEYLLDITCSTDEGDSVNKEVRFLIQPLPRVEIDD
ncbi:MAG: hypothetical protein AABW58_03410 [Nanoarchaeota archaeon]